MAAHLAVEVKGDIFERFGVVAEVLGDTLPGRDDVDDIIGEIFVTFEECVQLHEPPI